QQARLEERDRQATEARKAEAAGRLAEALAAVERLLVIDREVYGDLHEDVIEALQWRANLHEQRADFATARRDRQEALALCARGHGPTSWQVADARRDLDALGRLEKLDATQRG